MPTTAIAPPARPPRTTRREILEFTTGSAKHKIDRERGVIHDVKIIGSRSRNGGYYPPDTLAAAKPLYEGARVNIDHPLRSQPDQERTFGDWFGVLQNVRHASDGLYGDLSYLMTHPLASQICEAAERFPASFGLSHNAQVTEGENEGQRVYEKIHHVRSVDIVCKPATTRGIFESEGLPTAGPSAAGSLAARLPAAGDQPRDAGGDDTGRDWNWHARRLLDLFSQNNRPANRQRVATELFGEMLAIERTLGALAAGAQPAASEDASPDAEDDAEGQAVESIRAAAPRTPAAPPAQLGAAAPTRTPQPPAPLVAGQQHAPAERLAACDRARIVLEGVGLEAESSRVAALAGMTNDNDRRALINGWLTSALTINSAGASHKPRSAAGPSQHGAANAAAPTATNWADPKLATIALLSR